MGSKSKVEDAERLVEKLPEIIRSLQALKAPFTDETLREKIREIFPREQDSSAAMKFLIKNGYVVPFGNTEFFDVISRSAH